MTPPKDQGANAEKSDGSLLELVRPVLVTDQTSLTKGQRKESKKYSQRRSRQVQASTRSTSSSDVDHQCLMAKSKKEDAQGVDQIKVIKKEFECLKLNYASLVSKSEVSFANSSSRIDSLEKENQNAQSQFGEAL